MSEVSRGKPHDRRSAAVEPEPPRESISRPAHELVSVVIPARNEEAHVEGALASVADQCYPRERLECVVVDNASADATVERATGFAARYPELQITVVSEPIVGVARAKNTGAKVARGRLLMFLDADSRMEPSLVSDVVASYQAGNPAGSIRVVADSQDRLERGFFDLMELGKVLFGIRTQMLYCDRQLFLDLNGFRPELRVAEDLEFLQRVQRHLALNGREKVCHIRSSAILTSPRRLRKLPYRLSLITVFARWAMAFAGIGRRRWY